MLHHNDDARFPPEVTLGIQAKAFNLGFIRPENLAMVGESFRCKLQPGCHVPFTEEASEVASVWQLYHKDRVAGKAKHTVIPSPLLNAEPQTFTLYVCVYTYSNNT